MWQSQPSFRQMIEDMETASDYLKKLKEGAKDNKPKSWMQHKLNLFETTFLMMVWGFVSAIPITIGIANGLAHLKVTLDAVMK
jgi:hypothetical protein